LKKELNNKKKDKIKSIHLCFTTDPFMNGYLEVTQMSLRLIKIINDFNIKCVVLTKGILPKELSTLSKKNEYGITLVSLNDNFRKENEPYSSSIDERIEALKYLHDMGFYTWVSIEPFPTPNIINQELGDILKRISFVNKIIFGRMNYNKLVSEYKEYKEFYRKQVNTVKTFCTNNNIQYYIKKGTLQ
jgi:DNA repair photolyase